MKLLNPNKAEKTVQERALQEELDIHKKLIGVLEGKLSSATTQLERERNRANESEETLEKLQYEVDRLKSVNANEKTLELHLQRERTARIQGEQELMRCQERLRNSDNMLQRLNDKNNQLKTEMDKKEMEYKSTIEKLVHEQVSMEKENKDLTSTLHATTNERDEYMHHSQLLVQQCEITIDERAKIEQQLSETESKIGDTIESEKKKTYLVREQLAKIEREKAKLVSYLQDRDREISRLQNDIKAAALSASRAARNSQQHGVQASLRNSTFNQSLNKENQQQVTHNSTVKHESEPDSSQQQLVKKPGPSAATGNGVNGNPSKNKDNDFHRDLVRKATASTQSSKESTNAVKVPTGNAKSQSTVAANQQSQSQRTNSKTVNYQYIIPPESTSTIKKITRSKDQPPVGPPLPVPKPTFQPGRSNSKEPTTTGNTGTTGAGSTNANETGNQYNYEFNDIDQEHLIPDDPSDDSDAEDEENLRALRSKKNNQNTNVKRPSMEDYKSLVHIPDEGVTLVPMSAG